MKISRDFQELMLTSEVHACWRSRTFGDAMMPYLGRGRPPKVVELPLYHNRREGRFDPMPQSSQTAQWWGALATRLQALSLTFEEHQAPYHIDRLLREIIDMIPTFPGFPRHQDC